jgi:hypothetical protein
MAPWSGLDGEEPDQLRTARFVWLGTRFAALIVGAILMILAVKNVLSQVGSTEPKQPQPTARQQKL